MYVPIIIGGISILQQFRPYFRKHISDKLDNHEYLFLNSVIICIIISVYLIFLVSIEHTNINKLLNKYKSLTLTELFFLTLLCIVTVISGIFIYELDKNHNTPFLNSIYLKLASVLALFCVGVFMFKENYKIHQIIGVAIIILGIFLVSTKKLSIL
jgi:uncharacterized membrane protein